MKIQKSQREENWMEKKINALEVSLRHWILLAFFE